MVHLALRFAPLALILSGCPKPEPQPSPYDGGRVGLAVHDPLSRPEEPTLSVNDFSSAQRCATCHETHYQEWRTSTHAYATQDPIFRALVKVRQADRVGVEDQFCVQCHSAIGTRGGEITPGFSFEQLSGVVLEGVTCEACHKVSEVRRTNNAGHMLDPGGPQRGQLTDPVATTGHDSVQTDVLGKSSFCGSCHDVVELSGLPLERPFAEYQVSPGAAQGRTCQSCHMPTYTGQAARDGPTREGLHRHRFIGVDLALSGDFLTEAERTAARAEVQHLLSQSASLAVAGPTTVARGAQLDVLVTVRNEIDAHNLPTGTTFMRQLWLEVVATDAGGRVLFSTGGLDGNGDLKNHFSALEPYGDNDLVTFGARLTNAAEAPELFPWRATELSTSALSPLYQRTFTFFVPVPADATGPVHVSSRLRFRSNPPFLLKALGLEALLPRLEIFDVAAGSLDVVLE